MEVLLFMQVYSHQMSQQAQARPAPLPTTLAFVALLLVCETPNLSLLEVNVSATFVQKNVPLHFSLIAIDSLGNWLDR